MVKAKRFIEGANVMRSKMGYAVRGLAGMIYTNILDHKNLICAYHDNTFVFGLNIMCSS